MNIDMEYKPLKENEGDFGMKYKRQYKEWFYYYAILYIRYINAYK